MDPLAIGIGLAVILVGFLILRFIVKTAITVVKLALLVGVGLAAWLGIDQVTGLPPGF